MRGGAQRVAQTDDVARLTNKRVLSAGLGQPTMARDNGWNANGPRLDDDQTQALVRERRRDEPFRSRHGRSLRCIVDKSEKTDVTQVELGATAFEAFAERAVADNRQRPFAGVDN